VASRPRRQGREGRPVPPAGKAETACFVVFNEQRDTLGRGPRKPN